MKLKIRSWGSAVVVAMTAGLMLANAPLAFAATEITADNHEGQKSDNSYTGGSITTYDEGDSINFRFTLEATDAAGGASGQMVVRFTGQESHPTFPCLFFEGAFTLGTHDASALPVVLVSGVAPSVTLVGVPVADGEDWVQTLDVAFTGDGEAVVNYFLTLSDEAGECTGASQGTSMDEVSGPAGGDFGTVSKKKVPVPANQIIQLPQITAIKLIDRDGNGSFEDTADAGEYCFRLDGGACVSTDASGEVVFTDVTPDGNHTITEDQVDFTQGTYEFVSGEDADNCTFVADTGTADVAAGATPQNATCTFNNHPTGTPVGDLEVVKELSPSTDPGLFDLQIDGTTEAADAGDGDSTGTQSVVTGTRSVGEVAGTGTALTNYTATIDCLDGAGNPVAATGTGPWDVNVGAGDDIVCTITNTRKSGGGGGGGGGAVGGGAVGGDSVVTAQGTCLDLVATIVGPAGDTIINGTPGNDVIVDLSGNNTVRGNGGDDVICTGPGNDDVATVNGNDISIDLGGTNRIHVAGGNDRVDAQGNSVIFGGPGADRIKVYDGKNRIRTFSGNDRVRAGGGNNFIRTGGGRDRVRTGNGDNDVGTHNGRDRVRTGSGDDFIRLNRGNDIGRAGKGDNTIRGGKKHDRLIARGGDDLLNGMNGVDTCRPGGGSNTLKNCEK